jgi:hypothetical protein
VDHQERSQQDLIAGRIDMWTHWLQALAEPTGCVVENFPRPGRGLYDYCWRVSFGRLSALPESVRLKDVETGFPEGQKRDILRRRFFALLKRRGYNGDGY